MIRLIQKTLIATIAVAALAKIQATPTEDGLYAIFKTSQGEFTAKLFYQQAPLSCANMVGLAEGTIPHYASVSPTTPIYSHFYDGLTFHRAVPGFMIQGGDPAGNGTGGPGYSWYDEVRPELKHDRAGILSMANSGINTNGSQFFVTVAAKPELDGLHNVFGEIVEGYDNVVKISTLPTTGTRNDVLVSPVTINSLRILRIGEAAQAFDPTFYADRFARSLLWVGEVTDAILYPHLDGSDQITASTPFKPLTDYRIEASDDLANWEEVARFAPSLRGDVETVTTTLVSPTYPTPQFMRVKATRGRITDMVGIADRIEGSFAFLGTTHTFRLDFEEDLVGTYTFNSGGSTQLYDWVEIGDDRVQLLIGGQSSTQHQYLLTWTSENSGTLFFRQSNPDRSNLIAVGTFIITPVE